MSVETEGPRIEGSRASTLQSNLELLQEKERELARNTILSLVFGLVTFGLGIQAHSVLLFGIALGLALLSYISYNLMMVARLSREKPIPVERFRVHWNRGMTLARFLGAKVPPAEVICESEKWNKG